MNSALSTAFCFTFVENSSNLWGPLMTYKCVKILKYKSYFIQFFSWPRINSLPGKDTGRRGPLFSNTEFNYECWFQTK